MPVGKDDVFPLMGGVSPVDDAVFVRFDDEDCSAVIEIVDDKIVEGDSVLERTGLDVFCEGEVIKEPADEEVIVENAEPCDDDISVMSDKESEDT